MLAFVIQVACMIARRIDNLRDLNMLFIAFPYLRESVTKHYEMLAHANVSAKKNFDQMVS